MESNILIVDDEENMLALLKHVLGKEGYSITCTDRGKNALKLAGESHFDLVIVDVAMPAMDGIEVLRRLKRMDVDLPVIMISAYSSWEKEQKAKELGCIDYFSKPLDMKRFKAVVKKAVVQRQM